MLIEFSKMHGLGNDFMVVDGVTQKVFFSNDIIKKLADRHFGIGFDQLLLVEPPYDPELDFHYRIFNADGSEVEQCGNGARCFARFVRLKGLVTRDRIAVSTARGRITLQRAGENQVTKEEMTAFYREEAETHRYLKEYDGFDARQLRKMTHLEKIDGKYLLFDYRNRSRLSQNAATYEVCFSNE